MKWYVYRFLDEDNNMIYIGKTNNLNNRMRQHFSTGHLNQEVYNMVKSIEYLYFESEADQHVAEMFLVNKYKPIFNTDGKKKDVLTLKVNINESWLVLNDNVAEYDYKAYRSPSGFTINQLRETINF